MIKVKLAKTLAAMALSAMAAASWAEQRIISADGALTEIVYALDAGDRVVGVDTTSTYPPQATALPQIGYKRALTAEGALSLRPSLLLASQESGPPEVLKQLADAGVNVEVLSAKPSLMIVKEKIARVSRLLQKQSEGEQLWQQVKAEVDKAQATVPQTDTPVKVLFILGFGNHGSSVGGADTAADVMIRMAGGVNIASGITGYKPMPAEAIVAAQPDVILLMNRGPMPADLEEVRNHPALKLTPAVQNDRIVSMDGSLLLGFGPRIGKALNQLAGHLYGADLVVK